MNQKTKKQIFRRFLLFLLIGLLSGCVNQKEPITQESPTPSPSPVVTPTPEAVNEIVGQASTKIFDNIPERNRNLTLAIQAINGMVLAPGEEFSFNRTVGSRTEEKGYKEAIGYDENGEKTPTIGGGVCQVSSTLYMAARNGDFEIVERHSHSHEVPYANSDNDATVSYEGYDFRFRNNRDKPVVIRMSTDDANVYATLILTP